MRLEHTPRPEQTVRVSARLITSSTILHLSSDELERTINQEQIDNPTLAVTEQNICIFCGTHLYGQICPTCGHFVRETPTPPSYSDAPPGGYQQTFYDIDNAGFTQADSDDAFDPMAHICAGETLAENLLQQLETLIAPDDAPIAEQLVGNLNERGYLEISVEEIAQILAVPAGRVEHVLTHLQTLEPLGIGARDLRECLLIQLNALSELHSPHPLAYTLINCYLEPLGHNHFHEIARHLKVSEQEVREGSRYIRSVLHPFPAHIYQPDSAYSYQGGGATYIRPDVIIRNSENGYEVELVEEKRYHFNVRASYDIDNEQLDDSNPELQSYIRSQTDRARFFVDCVQRRWRTLLRVAELIVDYQREFLARGVRYLRPLTRAEVATRLNLDEGTVSRTTANKYALLPDGRLIPLSDFFDSSLSIKDIIRELIQYEKPTHRLSDEEIARTLTARGTPMARRTVTKYREEMGIGSSRER